MRLIDIISKKPRWQTLHYNNLYLGFSRPWAHHDVDINLDEMGSVWQRLKFAIWIFKALGGKD